MIEMRKGMVGVAFVSEATIDIPDVVIRVNDLCSRLAQRRRDLELAIKYVGHHRDQLIREMRYRVSKGGDPGVGDIEPRLQEIVGPEAIEAPALIATEMSELRTALRELIPALDKACGPLTKEILRRLHSATGHDLAEVSLAREWLLRLRGVVRQESRRAPEKAVLGQDRRVAVATVCDRR